MNVALPEGIGDKNMNFHVAQRTLVYGSKEEEEIEGQVPLLDDDEIGDVVLLEGPLTSRVLLSTKVYKVLA